MIYMLNRLGEIACAESDRTTQRLISLGYQVCSIDVYQTLWRLKDYRSGRRIWVEIVDRFDQEPPRETNSDRPHEPELAPGVGWNKHYVADP